MTLIAFLLLLMLWVTTPMGTADGVHSAMLLHPLFSHTHLVDGRIVVHNQVDDTSTTRTTNTGPAIGAEAGASAAASGPALSPTVPTHDLALGSERLMHWRSIETMPPRSVALAPPDPPPTLGS